MSTGPPQARPARSLWRRRRKPAREDPELRDFLEADEEAELADPAFKERLRRELWGLLQKRRRKR